MCANGKHMLLQHKETTDFTLMCSSAVDGSHPPCEPENR